MNTEYWQSVRALHADSVVTVEHADATLSHRRRRSRRPPSAAQPRRSGRPEQVRQYSGVQPARGFTRGLDEAAAQWLAKERWTRHTHPLRGAARESLSPGAALAVAGLADRASRFTAGFVQGAAAALDRAICFDAARRGRPFRATWRTPRRLSAHCNWGRPAPRIPGSRSTDSRRAPSRRARRRLAHHSRRVRPRSGRHHRLRPCRHHFGLARRVRRSSRRRSAGG